MGLGPALLVGHACGDIVITEAGNDPKVSGLLYVSVCSPDVGQSALSLDALVPPTPVVPEIRLNAGFLSLTSEAFKTTSRRTSRIREEDLTGYSGAYSWCCIWNPRHRASMETKPSWYMIASEDKVISPQLEAVIAQTINATTVTIHFSHAIMLSKQEAVFEVITRAAHGRD